LQNSSVLLLTIAVELPWVAIGSSSGHHRVIVGSSSDCCQTAVGLQLSMPRIHVSEKVFSSIRSMLLRWNLAHDR